MTNDQEDALSSAVRIFGRSPHGFVGEIMPLIRDSGSIDRILAALPDSLRAPVGHYIFVHYGEDRGPIEGMEWPMLMGSAYDDRARDRAHDAWVEHARRIAVPAMRDWLRQHPEFCVVPAPSAPRPRRRSQAVETNDVTLSMTPAQSSVAPDGSPSVAPDAGAPSSAPRVNAGIGQTPEGDGGDGKDGQ